MISQEATDWLNSIVTRHKRVRKVQRKLKSVPVKPPVTGGAGASDRAAIGTGA